MAGPVIVERIDGLRAQVGAWRRGGERIALVPTMGALHEGHVSLVRLARGRADRVVVSIFVNPTQFLPHEDFAKYPRTFEADVARLAAAGTDLVYHPDVGQMYPDGFATKVLVAGPAVAGLEDRVRPTHFDGVAVVVAKLLVQAAPDVAVFGEKDFQQLAVIRRMAVDLDLPVEIVGGPTVREADGLALSSRNVYLSPAERGAAPVLHEVLTASASALKAGEAAAAVLSRGAAEISAAGFALDYLELRDAASLAPVGDLARPARLLVAGRIGSTRLIDNIAV